MRTITETDWKTRFISWTVALIIVCCGILGMHFLSGNYFETKVVYGRTKKLNLQIKHEQAHRVLPSKYAKQLVNQSETQVRKKLEEDLKRFQEMSKKMRMNKNELLGQVERRTLSKNILMNANDTSEARTILQAPDILPENYSIDMIYEMLREYENEIFQNNIAVSAAKQALTKGLSFPEVYSSLHEKIVGMPSFEELVDMQIKGDGWSRNNNQSNVALNFNIDNIQDLSKYRELLGQVVRQVGLAESRLVKLFGVQEVAPSSMSIGNIPSGGEKKSFGIGDGEKSENDAKSKIDDGIQHVPWSYYAGEKLSKDLVKAQALPGRRFSKSAKRKGWLYINTWYMIGPWESYGRGDFAQIHPPEVSIDFDAVYTDGQIGKGIEETDADPIDVHGKEVKLDGILRWKFMQSESMHNVVPVTSDHATYYAYTEIYFDEAETMLVAIGTDDSGRLWINGKEIWEDEGASWYNIDEHIEPFEFKQGWNRILIRLENIGGSAAGFSFLIIPKE